jgi:hypothetical protein
LFDEITAQTNMPKKSSLPEMINPDTKTYLRNIIDSGMGLPKTTEKDTPLSAFGKSIARGTARLPLEVLNLPQAAFKNYIGAPLSGAINLGKNLVTPYEDKESPKINMTDEGFTVADNLEQLYRGGDDEMRKRIMATNPQAVATKAKEEGKEIKPIVAAKAEAAPIGANVVKTAEDVTGLQAILDKAFAFDKAAEEKAIKQQQGFDVAALGVQLVSTPLNQIDPALIRNLGVTNKELAGLDEKEAKKLIQKKLTELEIKKAEKELGSIDLVPLFPGIDEHVENIAQSKRLGQLAGVERNKLINAAQSAASIRALEGGHDPNSAMAERYLREELDKQADIFKNLVRSGTGDNAGRKAGDVANTLLQTGLPAGTPTTTP